MPTKLKAIKRGLGEIYFDSFVRVSFSFSRLETGDFSFFLPLVLIARWNVSITIGKNGNQSIFAPHYLRISRVNRGSRTAYFRPNLRPRNSDQGRG